MTVAIRSWLALAIIELVGAGTLTLLCSNLRRWGLPARLGLSFGLGQVALTLWLFVASLLGFKPVWWLGVGECAVLWIAVGTFRRRAASGWLEHSQTTSSPDAPAWLRWFECAAAVLLASTLLIVTATSVVEPLAEWDVVSFWALKAKVLLHEPLSSASYFVDPSKAYSQLDYPLLWPLTMAWIWAVVGKADLQAIKWLTPAMLCAVAGAFYGLVRTGADRARALLFTAVLFALPMQLSQTSRLSADVPFGFFVMASFACTYLWLRSGDEQNLKIAAPFACGMLLTKNEGIGLFVVLVIAATVTMATTPLRSRWRSASAWLVAVPLGLAAPWLSFRLTIPKLNIDYASRIDFRILAQDGSRVWEVPLRSFTYFGDFADWLVFWPLLALVLLITMTRSPRFDCMFLLTGLVLALGAYGFAYVITPWELGEIMDSTANRLLLHLAPLSVFLMAELAGTERLLPWPMRAR